MGATYNAGALSDITILDLTRVLSGPFGTSWLSDMGAHIIKFENPNEGDSTRYALPFTNGESVYYATINRNKKTVTLNLKSEKGREMFLRMVEKADVVAENFRPGVMDRLKLGIDELNLSAIYFNFRNGDQDVPEIADNTMANAEIEVGQDNNVSEATLHPQIIAEKPLTVNNRVKQRATTEEEEAEYRVKVAEEEYAQRKAEEEIWAENVIAVTYALQEQELLELQRQIDIEYEQKYLASLPAPQVIEVP